MTEKRSESRRRRSSGRRRGGDDNGERGAWEPVALSVSYDLPVLIWCLFYAIYAANGRLPFSEAFVVLLVSVVALTIALRRPKKVRRRRASVFPWVFALSLLLIYWGARYFPTIQVPFMAESLPIATLLLLARLAVYLALKVKYPTLLNPRSRIRSWEHQLRLACVLAVCVLSVMALIIHPALIGRYPVLLAGSSLATGAFILRLSEMAILVWFTSLRPMVFLDRRWSGGLLVLTATIGLVFCLLT